MSLLQTPAGVLRTGAGPGTWRKTPVSRGAPRASRNWVLSISQRVSAGDGRGGSGRARGAVPHEGSRDACQAV